MSILSQWTNRQSSFIKNSSGSASTGLTPNSTTTDPTLVNANRNYLVVIKQNQDKQTVPGLNGSPMIVVGQIAQDFQIDQAVKWATPWGAGVDGTVGDIMAAASGNRLIAQVMSLQVWQGAGNDIDFTVSFELRAWSSTSRDVMIPLQYLSAMSLPSIDSSGFLISPGPILNDKGLEALGQAIPKAIGAVGKAAGSAALAAGKELWNGITGSKSTTSDGASKAFATIRGDSEEAKDLKSAIGGITRKAFIEQHMQNKISITLGQWFQLDNVVITNVQHTLKPQLPGPDGGLMAADVTVSFRPMFALTTEDVPSILRVRGSQVNVTAPLKIG